MSSWLPPTNEAIEHEAYLLWEADGRPYGRDYEFWMRASGVLTERAQVAAAAEADPETGDRRCEMRELFEWSRGVDKPIRMQQARPPKRWPRMRGPATRPVRLGKRA